MEIRQARLRDYFQVRQVFKDSFGRDAWSSLDIALALLTPGAVKLLALNGDDARGFAIGDRRGSKVGWVAAIGVVPEARRRGIGSRLLAECEERLGTETVRLTLRRSNHAARELYLKHGYVLKTVWTGYYYDGEDAFVMEKVRGESGPAPLVE